MVKLYYHLVEKHSADAVAIKLNNKLTETVANPHDEPRYTCLRGNLGFMFMSKNYWYTS